MNWTDEQLMAYVDGELGAPLRGELEQALAGDAALRGRVEAWRVQRRRIEAALAPVLDEPVPERLSRLLAAVPAPAPAPAPAAAVIDLAAARAAREAPPPRRAAPGWWAWGGMAASLVLGVLLGQQGLGSLGAGGSPDAAVALRDGRLVAGGALDGALSRQLAGDTTAVALPLSFVDRDGAYCRAFRTAELAGLACRRDGAWAVQALAAAPASAPAAGTMRQAAAELPREVLLAVDQRIAGDALDAAAERAARDRGWQR